MELLELRKNRKNHDARGKKLQGGIGDEGEKHRNRADRPALGINQTKTNDHIRGT